MEGYVLGLVDDTHPAAPEFFDDAVMRDDLVDHDRGAGTQAAIVRMSRSLVNEGHTEEELRCQDWEAQACLATPGLCFADSTHTILQNNQYSSIANAVY
jgi:hypothetical protein